MSDMDYVYAVARIRCKELKLFSAAVIEQLLARPDYDACVSFLAEKGCEVSIVELRDALAPDMEKHGRFFLLEELKK